MSRFSNASFLRFRSEYFLFALPLFFVGHGYTEYFGDIPGKDAFLLALEYLGSVVGISGLFALFFRSFRKAAIFSFLVSCFYFFFGASHDVAKEWLGKSFLVSYSFILPAAFLAFGTLYWYLKKTSRQFHRLTRYLNLVLLLLLLVDGALLTMKSANVQVAPAKATVPVQPPAGALLQRGPIDYPDIHLIIADEYAGHKALQEALHFDNTAFEDSLRNRGFRVVENSRSNYNYTPASMASLFAMDYLPQLSSNPDEEVFTISKAVINRNKFGDIIKSKGYTIKNYSIFEFAGQPSFAEPYFPQHLKLITRNTFLGRIKEDIGYHAALTLKIPSALNRVKEHLSWEAQAETRKISSVLKEIERPHQGPRFFYTHLMMPHRPYLLDRNEKLLRLESMLHPEKDLNGKENYLEYLQYANKKLLQFIDEIKRKSVTPPVILLMSDHGFRRDWVPQSHHFSNINAVFVPGEKAKAFYPGITNVNQLRVLLNQQFDLNLPSLADSSVFLGIKGLY